MNTTESTPLSNGQASVPAALPRTNELAHTQGTERESFPTAAPAPRRQYGYGLPCAKCRTYYAADLPACPVCKSPERVSPAIMPVLTVEPEETVPDPETLEQERERFLREFKSQAFPGQMQINAAESFRCSKEENHQGGFEPAAICQGCYDHLRERADLLEASLLIDVKEATQLIYDAVWADPSDPSKTYLNAAQALLNELRRRAGISAVLGPMQPLQH